MQRALLIAMLMGAAGLFVLAWRGAERTPESLHFDKVIKPTTHKIAQESLSTKEDAFTEAGIEALPQTDEDPHMLERLLETWELPATRKAELIDAAMSSEDSRMAQLAENLVRDMIRMGSVADALAAIPKTAYFPESLERELTELQQSLCRFQTLPDGEFGFEMVKTKFDRFIGRKSNARDWDSVCKAG